MVAEMLAVIRGDDHQGVVEHAPTAEFLEEDTESLVEVRDTIVIDVAGHPDVIVGQLGLLKPRPAPERQAVVAGPGPKSKSGRRPSRDPLRRVGARAI